MWSPMVAFFLWFPPILEFPSSANYHTVVYSVVYLTSAVTEDWQVKEITYFREKNSSSIDYVGHNLHYRVLSSNDGGIVLAVFV